VVTVEDSVEKFLADCAARNLNTSTYGKHKRLTTRLSDYCVRKGIARLDQLTPEALRHFRTSWDLGPRTALKELERLRAFLRFCVENSWLLTNPARVIKPPQVRVVPRVPFSAGDIQKIIAVAKDDRELAFILTLRHTGLRIGDASLLRVTHLSENRIYLYTTKAGTPVSIVIPERLVALLNTLRPRGGFFFVRGESTAMHTTADLWRRRIKILCKEAGVLPDHPHRFRHTLAADLLSRGASVEDVAAVLGNSPAVVHKHYSQWIKGRQDRLDEIVSSTWKPALVRVK
jgi:integrase